MGCRKCFSGGKVLSEIESHQSPAEYPLDLVTEAAFIAA
jgi:hypothetical protein